MGDAHQISGWLIHKWPSNLTFRPLENKTKLELELELEQIELEKFPTFQVGNLKIVENSSDHPPLPFRLTKVCFYSLFINLHVCNGHLFSERGLIPDSELISKTYFKTLVAIPKTILPIPRYINLPWKIQHIHRFIIQLRSPFPGCHWCMFSSFLSYL